MRKLVALAIAGIAVVAIVIYFAHTPSDSVAPAAAESASASAPQVSSHDVTVEAIDPHAQPAATARENASRAATPLTTEQQQRAACTALSTRRVAREKAALDLEPKDAAWAYPMEQKLREYLTQRLQSGRLEVVDIDCRTTFCKIRALLLDPEGGGEFNNAISEAAGKPWNDFTGTDTGPSEESGKTFYSGRLSRPQFKMPSAQTAEEAQAEAACSARSIEKQAREREARDAQPKDRSWAEPMEQLLRQHLTTQLAKHAPDRIDIDCRTTYCKVAAEGRGNDTSMAFQKVAQAVGEEPWAELRSGEGGGSSYGDDWKQEYFLYRRQ